MQDVTKDRDKYIGGSDVPAIMNLSPFKTRWQLLQEKAGVVTPTFNGNMYTEYGNTMEPKIREYVNAKYDMNFVEDKVTNGFIRYHADGYDKAKNMVLEIKTTSKVFDEVNDYEAYIVQLLTGIKQYHAETGFLAVYERPDDFSEEFDPERLTVYPIEISHYGALVERITAAVTQFWSDLEQLKADPFLSEEDMQPFPVIANAQIVVQLEERLAAMKEIEKECKAAKEDLKKAMTEFGVKSWTTPNGTKITLVPDGEDTTVSEFDMTAFKTNHPDMVDMYTVQRTKKGRAGYVKVTLPK